MMKIGTVIRRLANSGYDEPIYRNLKSEIQVQNQRMAETTSFIGGVMMLLLSVAALFVPSIARVLPLYLVTAAMFVGVFFANKIVGRKSGGVTLICSYAFLAASFFFALGLDIVQKNATATTVCVLLVALPLLIVDRPLREFAFFLVMSICFMLESVYIKQSPKASIDVLNSVSFLCIGAFLGYKHNQMVLRNLNGHRLLERQRDTDTLTNLYNKSALESRARAYLSREGAVAGLLVIDMDNFKFVNDTYGHHTGDEILNKFGSMLSSLFRSDDILCRFGGDEFIVFLPKTSDREMLTSRARQILDGVDKLRIEADTEYRAHICIGIATYPFDGDSFEDLFRSADTAMYRVKKHGKNGYGFFNDTKKKKILIVDDIELNRVVLRETLKDDYMILEADNGESACETLGKNPDTAMIITDIQMPGMDGISLIRKIRENKRFDSAAIVANTQHGDPEQEEIILKLGVDDFVYKASTPGIIQTRVKNVLRAKEL